MIVLLLSVFFGGLCVGVVLWADGALDRVLDALVGTKL